MRVKFLITPNSLLDRARAAGGVRCGHGGGPQGAGHHAARPEGGRCVHDSGALGRWRGYAEM